MREGYPTSLVIAAGPNVTINMILGLPFITQTKMVIDTSNPVTKLHAFDMPPFPINLCCVMCAIPVIDDAAAAANAALHANIVKEIKLIKEHIYKKNDALLLQERTPGNVPSSILLSPKQTQLSNSSTLRAIVMQVSHLLGLGLTHSAHLWRQMPTI